MDQDESAFLRELQEACMKEVEDYLNDFREILSTFKDDTTGSIEHLQKVIHSMKGNLQAVAFLQFGKYVHELETILELKSKALVPPAGKLIPEFEVLICEYLLSSVLEAMESYLMELKRVSVDCDDFFNARKEQLKALEVWLPKFESTDVPMFTPQSEISYQQPDIETVLAVDEIQTSVALDAAKNEAILIKPIVPDIEVPDFGGFEMDEQNNNETPVADVALEVPSLAAVEVPSLESAAPSQPAEIKIDIPDFDIPIPVEAASPAQAVAEVPPQAAASAPKKEEPPSNAPKRPNEWLDYRGSGLFLLFQNHKKYFAIAIEHIVEVIKSQPLSTPPHKRKNLRGLLNLRGEVLPILNMEEILTENDQKSTYVVVSQVEDMRFGFQVESVHQVVTLDPKVFQAVEGLSTENQGVVTHFCQTEDKTISILRLNELVAA